MIFTENPDQIRCYNTEGFPMFVAEPSTLANAVCQPFYTAKYLNCFHRKDNGDLSDRLKILVTDLVS